MVCIKKLPIEAVKLERQSEEQKSKFQKRLCKTKIANRFFSDNDMVNTSTLFLFPLTTTLIGVLAEMSKEQSFFFGQEML